MSIRVVVVGAGGRMGRETVRAVLNDDTLALVGAVDTKNQGIDIGTLVGTNPCGVLVAGNLGRVLEETAADVAVDFTTPEIARRNLSVCVNHKVHAVIGTTGISEDDVPRLHREASEAGIGVVIAPNFAVGAILMMKFAAEAAKYFPNVEIIEFHHDQKLDAPSGTAVKTAELIKTARSAIKQGHPEEFETINGSRGGEFDGMRIHSVRLPGLVAHQEVIFGGLGQTLTIRHDSINRESFMPGVVLAVKKVVELKGVIYGLDKLLT